MKKLILLIAPAAFLLSCGNNNRTNRVDYDENDNREVITANTPNSRYTLDYTGTYKGTLPCADCKGIETELRIKSDGDYVLKTKHLANRDDQKDLEAEYRGNYSWNNDGRIITLNGVVNQPNKYLVSEDMLVQLDMNGNRIDGNLADKYILKK